MSGPDAAALDRTRSAVLNVLIVAALGIALSGGALRQRDPAGTPFSPVRVRGPAQVALAALFAASVAARRIIASRTALRDPARRASRLYRGHVVAAVVGALAVPLGFAYGWEAEPDLRAIAPFWVAALALGILAIPRASGLDDLDDPREPLP